MPQLPTKRVSAKKSTKLESMFTKLRRKPKRPEPNCQPFWNMALAVERALYSEQQEHAKYHWGPNPVGLQAIHRTLFMENDGDHFPGEPCDFEPPYKAPAHLAWCEYPESECECGPLYNPDGYERAND